jgi:hypothetical protein
MKDKKLTATLSEVAPILDGDLSEQWFEVAKTGKYYDVRYGNFEVTAEQLANFAANFASNVLNIKVALDCNHDWDKGAMAWIGGLEVRDNSLYARFEDWTPEGEQFVREGKYRYFSIDFAPLEIPTDDGVKVVPDVIRGIALTNRPVLKSIKSTFSEEETKNPDVSGAKTQAMKNLVKKFGDSMLAAEKVTKQEAERFQAMLADLPEADRTELKELSEKVSAKVTEAETRELAEKKTVEDAGKTLAETTKRLAELEASNATLLAEKTKVETEAVIGSMMLSETNLKGFTEAKKEVVTNLVKEVGIDHAKKFAAALSEVTDMTGKTKELGHGKAEGEVDSVAQLAEATARSKKSGREVHVELADVIKETLK